MNESPDGVRMDEIFVETLTTRYDAADDYNPKTIKFMTFGPDVISTNDDAFIDPWGNAYRALFDINEDGKVCSKHLDGAPVFDRVIAWSGGPDGDPLTLDDNISSWE